MPRIHVMSSANKPQKQGWYGVGVLERANITADAQQKYPNVSGLQLLRLS